MSQMQRNARAWLPRCFEQTRKRDCWKSQKLRRERSPTCWNSNGLSRKSLVVQPSEITNSCSRTATSGEGHSLSNASCGCSSSEIVLAHLTPELRRTAARPGVMVHVTI